MAPLARSLRVRPRTTTSCTFDVAAPCVLDAVDYEAVAPQGQARQRKRRTPEIAAQSLVGDFLVGGDMDTRVQVKWTKAQEKSSPARDFRNFSVALLFVCRHLNFNNDDRSHQALGCTTPKAFYEYDVAKCDAGARGGSQTRLILTNPRLQRLLFVPRNGGHAISPTLRTYLQTLMLFARAACIPIVSRHCFRAVTQCFPPRHSESALHGFPQKA